MIESMQRDLGTLARDTFDLVVVGGGVTGAAIAHDATLRGLRVALVEKDDFAGATSAASSKLLHGGVRYLQQMQFGKVRESAVERAAFQRIAPHLCRYVPFLIPTTREFSKGRALVGAGLGVYQVLTAGADRGIADASRRAPAPHFIARDELARRYPALEALPGLTGAWVIHESHMHSSERMTLAFLRTAAAHGAALANYAAVDDFLIEGQRVVGVRARDAVTGAHLEIRAKLVANAAGPWIARLNDRLRLARLERDITGFSKGAHLITRPIVGDAAVALPTRLPNQAIVSRGGRHVFVIPWRGHALVGTTNLPFDGDLDEVGVSVDEIEAFLDEINRALPSARLTLADVRHAFAGLYPLTEDVIRPGVYQGTGVYQLVDHARSARLDGLITVLGAKYTTARGLAERAVDLAVRKIGVPARPCASATTPLAGGATDDVTSLVREVASLDTERVDEALARHLVGHYGTEATAIVALGRSRRQGLDRLSPLCEVVEAEVVHTVRHEVALRLDDVVFRRTGLGTLGHPGMAALERAAELMAETLGWDAARRAAEVTRTTARFPLGVRS
jgi:glycerol-3-phosphate dehydrogenase